MRSEHSTKTHHLQGFRPTTPEKKHLPDPPNGPRSRAFAGQNNDFLLSEDVAELLGAARSTVQEWCRLGRIPNRRMPGQRRCIIPRRDFDAWLEGTELETIKLAGGGRIVRPVATKRGRV